MRITTLLVLVFLACLSVQAGDVTLTVFQPRKLLYIPGEAAQVDAQVTSSRATTATVTLTVMLVKEFTPVATLPPVTVTLKPGETQAVSVPFTASSEEYGWTAVGELKEGTTLLDRAVDVFNVADNVFKVGIGAQFEMMQLSGFSWIRPETDIVRARKCYMNTWEKFFWAPCDWADLCPTGAEWTSGQGGRYEVREKMQTMLRLCKENGIRSITYSQPTSAGPKGWEVARRHPDWFYLDTLGRPAGEWDAEDFLYWDTRHEMMKKYRNDDRKWPYQFSSTWHVLYPDFSRVDTLDYGIDRLIDGAQMWGWDGVRFDGNWGAGDDEMSTRNFQRQKARVWAKLPNFTFGYNDNNPGAEPSFAATHAFRERMGGYAEEMNEMIRGWGGRHNGAPFTYRQWRDYAEGMCGEVDATRKAGGTPWAILDTGKTYYKFMLAMAAGEHTCYGDHFVATGCPNWGRFLTRWSGLLYDVHLQRIDPKDKLEVKAAGTLWWDKWVSERVASTTRFQRIVSLIVPPANPDIPKDDRGAPVTNLVVRTKLTGTLTGAWLIDSTQGDEPVKLEVKTDAGWAAVTVPQVTGWSLVVWEFAGQYVRPGNGPRFTEPFDQAKVDKALTQARRPQPKDPIRPDDDPTKSGALIVREAEDIPIFVEKTAPVADPKASGGVARRRDGTGSNTGGCFGQNLYTNLTPGHYKATYRLAIEDKSKWSGVALSYRYNSIEAMPVEVKPESFAASGEYQDFSYELDYLGPGTLSIDGFFRGQQTAGAMRFDKVTLELLKAFSDVDMEGLKRCAPLSSELVPGTPLPPPRRVKAASTLASSPDKEEANDAQEEADDQATAETKARYVAFMQAPLRVLLIAGLHSNLYALNKAFPTAWAVTTVYTGQNERTGAYVKGFPDIPTLFQYNVVVLANVDGAALGFNGRRQLRHFVRQGGGLLVLGGMQALGQGGYRNSFLGDVLPLTLAPSRDVQAFPQPAKLALGSGDLLRSLDLKEAGGVFYRHRVEVKVGAGVPLLAGSEPVLITGDAGKGRAAVFTGTVLGGPSTPGQGYQEPAPAMPAFWNGPAWPRIVEKTVTWLGKPSLALDHTPDPNAQISINPNKVSAIWLCSLSGGSADGAARLAVDGKAETAVRRTGDAAGVPGAALKIDLGEPYCISKVRLQNVPNRGMIAAPEDKGWGQPNGPTLLRGSNDGANWVTLLTVPAVGAEMDTAWYDFPTTEARDVAFRYVQLYGGSYTISEIQIWGMPPKP